MLTKHDYLFMILHAYRVSKLSFIDHWCISVGDHSQQFYNYILQGMLQDWFLIADAFRFKGETVLVKMWTIQGKLSSVLLLWFILNVIVRPLDVLFVLFMISWWPSAKKELSFELAFRSCCFNLSRLHCLCSFPVWCQGSIVSVPDHCLFIYIDFVSDWTIHRCPDKMKCKDGMTCTIDGHR